MQRAKYRIRRVRAEGFRAFTDPQTVEVDGKNIFIFGANGQGKSSLIEAIRWALFGSPAGRDIEVRNTFYDKAQCCVTLELSSANGGLEITRELRPGTNLSRQTIRDSSGNAVSAKDVLPQLARIGHHEGTQVIFAAQHAAGRQAQVDITDFTRVLCFYLRLERVPELLDAMEALVEERNEEYRQLAQRVESAQGELRFQMQEIQNRISELLRNPPWGEGPLPTSTETEAKIVALSGEANTEKGASKPEGESSQNALNRLRHELEILAAKAISALWSNLETAVTRLRAAEKDVGIVSQSRERRASLTQELESTTTRLSLLMEGHTVESLKARLGELERNMSEKEAAADLAERAKSLCTEFGWSECPVCGEGHSDTEPPAPLITRIQARIAQNAGAGSSPRALDEIRHRLREIATIEKSKEVAEQELRSASSAEHDAEARLTAVIPSLSVPIDLSSARAKTDELRQDVEVLSGRIDVSQGDHPRWIKRIKDLEQELMFHSYRNEIQRLQERLTDGLSASLDILRQYQELLSTTTELKNLLGKAFDEALDRAVPPLEQMLTDVFRRMTQQVSYDQVRIFHSPEPQRRRELRVASSRLPNQVFQPNVLNGQASKSLQLVPYFVFSKFQPDVMELDLLLIDDPSESFDTSHVADLIKELGVAANHAQLFVATHEKEKFEPHLDSCFEKDAVRKVSVTGFAPIEGPRFAIT